MEPGKKYDHLFLIALLLSVFPLDLKKCVFAALLFSFFIFKSFLLFLEGEL